MDEKSTQKGIGLLKRALELSADGDFEGAIALLTAALDSEEFLGSAELLPLLTQDLAIMCEQAGRPGQAIHYVQRSVMTYPGNLASLCALTRLLAINGQKAEAAEALAQFSRACDGAERDPSDGQWAELRESLREMIARIDPSPAPDERAL